MVVFYRDLITTKEVYVQFNASVCRLMTSMVSTSPECLTNPLWDFIMCSLTSWIQVRIKNVHRY